MLERDVMTESGSQRVSVPGFEDEGGALWAKESRQSLKGRNCGKENWFIPRVSRKEGTPAET